MFLQTVGGSIPFNDPFTQNLPSTPQTKTHIIEVFQIIYRFTSKVHPLTLYTYTSSPLLLCQPLSLNPGSQKSKDFYPNPH